MLPSRFVGNINARTNVIKGSLCVSSLIFASRYVDNIKTRTNVPEGNNDATFIHDIILSSSETKVECDIDERERNTHDDDRV